MLVNHPTVLVTSIPFPTSSRPCPSPSSNNLLLPLHLPYPLANPVHTLSSRPYHPRLRRSPLAPSPTPVHLIYPPAFLLLLLALIPLPSTILHTHYFPYLLLAR